MNYSDFLSELGDLKVDQNVNLAQYTTLNIGGPADILFTAENIQQIIDIVAIAKKHNIQITILGQGSNVLISDAGIRGLVIINKSSAIQIQGKSELPKTTVHTEARWESDKTSGTFKGIEFKDLDYDESDCERIEVVMDSGVNLSYAMKHLIEEGITGLQWFAGIPGTIGGAVYNNIHGGTHFISEYITSVKVIDQNLGIKDLAVTELEVDYDKSRFHNSKEIVLQATFNLFKGDVERARFTAQEWIKRKLIQPRNSPGSAFANIDQATKEKLGYPTTATGYIVEQVLKMKGFEIGDAAIYKDHHNFIINKGHATAKDYLEVLKEIHRRAQKEVGINLVLEIVLLGFTSDETVEFVH